MAGDDEPIRPMTLGSMRLHGVRGLFVTCKDCGQERAVNMDDWPDDATVASFGLRMRCSHCGKLGATAVPNWISGPTDYWAAPGDDGACGPPARQPLGDPVHARGSVVSCFRANALHGEWHPGRGDLARPSRSWCRKRLRGA
jgi:hypothetical protein